MTAYGFGDLKKVGRFANALDAAICANANIAYSCGEFAHLNSIMENWGHD